MSFESVLAPQVGESIKEVRILSWKKSSGDLVRSGEVLLEIETDKASVEVSAPFSGKLEITKSAEETVLVGSVIGKIDTSVKVEAGANTASSSTPLVPAKASPSPSLSNGSASPSGNIRKDKDSFLAEVSTNTPSVSSSPSIPRSPAATHVPEKLIPGETRKALSRLRLKIAENLVRAQNEFAILTTFNEVDLTQVGELRTKHKDDFKKKNGVGLGYMSFFTRACCLALKDQPLLNASIDGTDMILRDFVNMGVAVGTDRGLVVPVLHNADKLSFAQIEQSIAAFADKAKNNKLSIDDMSGGTFTISNGGVYGSLLSTPILNPPQSGILGMHNIVKRPIVVNDKIEIRPMMYLALSYDHRIVDGKEAVSFLVNIKKRLENPTELNLDF
ncbi:MAG: 2-oxoglutarate dehydrogenase complex dihydrolipoyllysine-residue succinyltransferase [bacterium]